MRTIINWLSNAQNATVIQAIAAIGGFIVTICLLIVTAWYVRLTHALSRTAAGQLHASLQPSLVFEFVQAKDGKLGAGQIVIRNEGNTAIQIRRAFIEGISTCEVGRKVRFNHFEHDTSLAAVVLPAHRSCAAKVDLSQQLKEKGLLEPTSGLKTVRWVLYLSCSDLLGLTQHGFMYDSEESLCRYRSPFEPVRRPTPSDYLNIAEVEYPEGVPLVGLPVGANLRFEMRKTGVHELFDIDPSWSERLARRWAQSKRDKALRKQEGELLGLERLRRMFAPRRRVDTLTSRTPPDVDSELTEPGSPSQSVDHTKARSKRSKRPKAHTISKG